MRMLLPVLLLAAGPALAATGPFFSLGNTDFIVTLAFLLFVGILVYFKVPALIGGLLDKRAATIRAELDEARALREEAQTILASYERKQKEMMEQSDIIVATAKKEAMAAADKAKADLKTSIARRLKAAEEQIASAEKAAVNEVRNRAVSVAVAAASEIIARDMQPADKSAQIDAAIGEVEARLH
ncbi:F0F1 ATP synthase subunit B [Frigidibacter oleivorans]|uniref:F0F1 ATP synthase subunit B n=1 Tax=Frigidibacter oleivorans TaxID=2487129 RepID=UPI000F8E6394|nr:F0F1 ATP synthase subunit B [Frigidibacter oleivorans]